MLGFFRVNVELRNIIEDFFSFLLYFLKIVLCNSYKVVKNRNLITTKINPHT